MPGRKQAQICSAQPWGAGPGQIWASEPSLPLAPGCCSLQDRTVRGALGETQGVCMTRAGHTLECHLHRRESLAGQVGNAFYRGYLPARDKSSLV